MNCQRGFLKSGFITYLTALAVVAVLMLPGRAGANLLDRGPDMVYDDVLNITWTRNANLPGSSSLTWAQATSWAASLVLDSVSGWQLATMSATSPTTSLGSCSSGATCAASGNQLGYMYYGNLGGTGGDKSGTQVSLLGGQTLTGIAGIQTAYWSGTEFNSGSAWHFRFFNGDQFSDGKNLTLSAWAVHPGDVAAVPEPETYAMMLAGLGLMGFVARRRKQKEAAGA